MRQAEAEIKQSRAQNEQLDHDAGSYRGMVLELERYFGGVRSAHQAFLRLDEVEGRAIAAEAILAEAEKLAPDTIAQARQTVCAPPAARKELAS